jgi:hypothetical protein
MGDPWDAVVEFVGGPDDGYVADTRSAGHLAAGLAEYVCRATGGGRAVGQVLVGMSVAGLEAVARDLRTGGETRLAFRADHPYRVAGRRREGGRVVIRLVHAPGSPPGSD